MAFKENTNHFYSISIPLDSDSDQINETDLIFESKTEALNILKKYKGSRFKVFDNEKDAILFSKQRILTELNTNGTNISAQNVEKSLSPFSSPHTRDLTQLRKAIEKGDYERVKDIIWSNPRYLVSSGETPVVLMEGPRYNACHISAKECKSHILQLILNTVSDRKFMKMLFPCDESEITDIRIDFLLDLYLNTPDKGFCETPLHFAAKFGSLESISVLLTFPKCDLEKRNKLGFKASEIVCERNGDKTVKSEILKLFEAQLYIPLIREDFSAQVGEPFKGKIEDERVSGLAGPMSPKQADLLFNTLRSPRKCTPREKRIRLTDPQKGLERIARNFCHDMKVNWIEFWPFLNVSIDLSSYEGLNQLEQHLRNVYFRMDCFASSKQSFSSSQEYINNTNNNSISLLCNKISKLDINPFNSSDVLKDIEKNDSISSISVKPFFSMSNNTDESQMESEDESDNESNYETDYEVDDSDGSYSTAPNSPIFLFKFYINGTKLSKDDIDAALAIQHKVNEDHCLQLDYIQNWFYRILSEQPQHFNDFNENINSEPFTSTPIKLLNCKNF